PVDGAGGLADALPVIDEGEAYVAPPPGTEPEAGRGGHLPLRHQELGELQGPHLAIGLRDRSPDEHGALGLGHDPADAAQSLAQRVAGTEVYLVVAIWVV